MGDINISVAPAEGAGIDGALGSGWNTVHENDMLPVANATTSYWRANPHRIDSHRSTPDLPVRCKVCVIGAGLSGVSVVHHLSKHLYGKNAAVGAGSQSSPDPQSPDILLLEARQVCSGATGRNGGHVKYPPHYLSTKSEKMGDEFTRETARFVGQNMAGLKQAAETELGPDGKAVVELEVRRTFDIFADKGHADSIARGFTATLQRFAERGYPEMDRMDIVTPQHIDRVTLFKDAHFALSSPALSLWPYKFVTHLLDSLLAQHEPRINVQTETPVLSVSLRSGPDGEPQNVITTARGTVIADKLVFATNAYTSGLLKQYRNVIVPYKGTCSHISPLSAADAGPDHKGSSAPVGPRLANTYNINWTASRREYMNPRPDGGIVYGGAEWTFHCERRNWWNNWDDSTLVDDAARAHFDSVMHNHFHGWEHAPARGGGADAVWTGIMAQTKDELPHVGHVPGSQGAQLILAGYNGGGMSFIFEIARGIAAMLAKGTEFTDSGLPRWFQTTADRLKQQVFPPES